MAPPHMIYMMIWYPEGKKEKKRKILNWASQGIRVVCIESSSHTHAAVCKARTTANAQKNYNFDSVDTWTSKRRRYANTSSIWIIK